MPLILILPLSLLAQWRGIQFDRFDGRDGLNSEDIRAIGQDSVGFMYFAGYQQLIRYDGRVFEDFTHDPDDSTSIGPGQISSMLLSKDGTLCLAMRRDGLNIFNPSTVKFRRYKVPVPENAANCVLEDGHGNLWIGGGNFTLLKFERKKSTFTKYQPLTGLPADLSSIAILDILQDKSDPSIFWLSIFGYQNPDYPSASEYNIARFDSRTGDFSFQPCAGKVHLQDSHGMLWAGSWADGLWRYDPSSGKCENLRFNIEFPSGRKPGDGIFDIYPFQGRHWLGSRSAIISVADDLTYQFVAKDEQLGSIVQFFEDADQNTWIATSDGLLVMHPGDQHIAYYSLAELGSTERIYPGRLAFHSGEQSIYLVNRNENRIYRIPLDRTKEPGFMVTPDRLYGVTVDHKGEVIVATQSSLYRCHFTSQRLEKIHSPSLDKTTISWLWSLEKGGDGIIAGAGTGGFYWVDDSTFHIRHLPHDNVFFTRVFLTDHGTALLSGGTAVYEVDLTTSTKRHLRAPAAEHVIMDKFGTYWIGTINTVGRYQLIGDSLHLLRYYTAKDGLVNITATHLHIDHRGRIWIFSNSGMSVIDPVSNTTRNIGVQDGLPKGSLDPVQVITMDDGRMCTVNDNGIIIFHPDSLWQAVSRPDVQVVLKDIRITGTGLGQHINTLQNLDLMSGQNTIDIQFQGLAFPNDRHITYSYKVDGLHQEWITLGKNNSVTLSRLPPGEYVFHVKAGEPSSNSPVKSLAFTIGTPFYLQAWFILICALLLIGALLLTYQFRVRRIKIKEAEKTRINKQIADLELQALRAQMNPHFMFNSLNSIKNYILRHESEKAAEYLSNFSHLIRMILQNSRETSVSLQDELETLLLYIDLEKLRFRDGFMFTCQIDDRIDISHIQIPPMIIQPFIENAIWHGLLHKENERHLAIRVSQNNGTVTCEIEDNGIGREKAMEIKSKSATRYKSMGMSITQDRIALLNTMNALGIHVDIIDKINRSGKPDGTLVKIQIPHAHHPH